MLSKDLRISPEGTVTDWGQSKTDAPVHVGHITDFWTVGEVGNFGGTLQLADGAEVACTFTDLAIPNQLSITKEGK